jgi:hypothetical protein
VRHDKLWTIFADLLAGLFLTVEYFKPLHANEFDRFPELSILFATQFNQTKQIGVAVLQNAC